MEYINSFEIKNGKDSKVETSYANDFLNSVQEELWDKEKNQFMFNIHHLIANTESEKMAKKELLKFSTLLFDPLGMLAPAL